MSDRPVSEVPGIGAKTEKILNAQGIATIGQLASCDYRLIQSVPKIITFITDAKKCLQEEITEANVAVTSASKNLADVVLTGKNSVPKDTKPESEATALLLHSHSWLGKRAIIPCGEDTRDIVIWELCVEPNNRVSMICAWLDCEQLCKMTYTPQFLIHYNPELPTLEVSMKPETLRDLLQREALSNTLTELDIMKRFC
jgi:hypothetical protein